MQALMYYDQRNIKLNDINIPVPEKDEVLIKVTDAGLCQTQVNEFIEGPYIINKTPHRVTGKAIPIIVGHEFGGIVEKVGNIKNSNLIGKQVAVLPLLKCGKCNYCKDNMESVCDDIAYYGLRGQDGGFAEYACVKKDNIFFTYNKNIITFIEPLLVAIHAANKIKDFIPNRKMCILGAGAIGISTAAVFRDYFGGNVVINDILPNRIKRVKMAGFQVKEKKELAPEYDVVIDCAGSNPTSKTSAITEGFSYLKKNGILLNLATYFHPISIVPSFMLLNEYKLITSYLYDLIDVGMLEKIINSLRVDFSKFITRIKLENIIEEGYYRSEVDKDSFTRLVVTP